MTLDVETVVIPPGIERRRAPRGTGELPEIPAEPDELLVRRAVLGDRAAFARLVTRHAPALYRTVFRVLRDHADTEDCVQETVLAAWRGLPAFRGESTVGTWLFVLARRSAQQHRHRNRPRVPAPRRAASSIEDVATAQGDPPTASADAGLRVALAAVLSTLPVRQRDAWILREVEELSLAEIAGVLGSSTASARGLLERARRRVATDLQDWR